MHHQLLLLLLLLESFLPHDRRSHDRCGDEKSSFINGNMTTAQPSTDKAECSSERTNWISKRVLRGGDCLVEASKTPLLLFPPFNPQDGEIVYDGVKGNFDAVNGVFQETSLGVKLERATSVFFFYSSSRSSPAAIFQLKLIQLNPTSNLKIIAFILCCCCVSC